MSTKATNLQGSGWTEWFPKHHEVQRSTTKVMKQPSLATHSAKSRSIAEVQGIGGWCLIYLDIVFSQKICQHIKHRITTYHWSQGSLDSWIPMVFSVFHSSRPNCRHPVFSSESKPRPRPRRWCFCRFPDIADSLKATPKYVQRFFWRTKNMLQTCDVDFVDDILGPLSFFSAIVVLTCQSWGPTWRSSGCLPASPGHHLPSHHRLPHSTDASGAVTGPVVRAAPAVSPAEGAEKTSGIHGNLWLMWGFP